MTTTTMNGWSLTRVPLATIAAGGHSTRVRAGAVATVLGHVARRFHAEVEPLVTFYGWRSVATNAAVGGHPRSNHPSGTAIDFNGYAHPYKAPINFTAAQVAAIRRILAEVAPVVRWGGDFGAALRDGMHFEIVGTAAQVTAVAARLTIHPIPAPLTPLPQSKEDDDMIPLIERTYRDLCDRTASLDEIAHWHDAARGRTAAWFLAAFRANPAETGTVRAAYRTILHRAPESAAVVTRWQKGRTIGQVWTEIADSAEAKARH